MENKRRYIWDVIGPALFYGGDSALYCQADNGAARIEIERDLILRERMQM